MFNPQRLLLNLSIPTLICAQCSPVQTSSVLPSPQSIPWFSDEFEEWYSVTQPWNTEHEGADLGRQGLPKQTFQHFSLFLTSPLPLLWEVPVTVNCLDLGTLQYNSVCFLASPTICLRFRFAQSVTTFFFFFFRFLTSKMLILLCPSLLHMYFQLLSFSCCFMR